MEHLLGSEVSCHLYWNWYHQVSDYFQFLASALIEADLCKEDKMTLYTSSMQHKSFLLLPLLRRISLLSIDPEDSRLTIPEFETVRIACLVTFLECLRYLRAHGNVLLDEMTHWFSYSLSVCIHMMMKKKMFSPGNDRINNVRASILEEVTLFSKNDSSQMKELCTNLLVLLENGLGGNPVSAQILSWKDCLCHVPCLELRLRVFRRRVKAHVRDGQMNGWITPLATVLPFHLQELISQFLEFKWESSQDESVMNSPLELDDLHYLKKIYWVDEVFVRRVQQYLEQEIENIRQCDGENDCFQSCAHQWAITPHGELPEIYNTLVHMCFAPTYMSHGKNGEDEIVQIRKNIRCMHTLATRTKITKLVLQLAQIQTDSAGLSGTLTDILHNKLGDMLFSLLPFSAQLVNEEWYALYDVFEVMSFGMASMNRGNAESLLERLVFGQIPDLNLLLIVLGGVVLENEAPRRVFGLCDWMSDQLIRSVLSRKKSSKCEAFAMLRARDVRLTIESFNDLVQAGKGFENPASIVVKSLFQTMSKRTWVEFLSVADQWKEEAAEGAGSKSSKIEFILFVEQFAERFFWTSR